jgi:hypothetical protein
MMLWNRSTRAGQAGANTDAAICKDLGVNEQLRRLWDFGRGARGVWRELLIVATCLGIGVIVMPCLIFLAGRIALGPYAHGNVFALWSDFIRGLVSGSQSVWFIVLGPYLFVWLFRGGRRLLHNQGNGAT